MRVFQLAVQPRSGHQDQGTNAGRRLCNCSFPVNVLALFDWLRQEHAYPGSYKSVLRFVRAHYLLQRLCPYRRVETPPGAQAQVDPRRAAGPDRHATGSLG